MAQPWFQVRHLQRSAGLIALSANFELYGETVTYRRLWAQSGKSFAEPFHGYIEAKLHERGP